MDAVTAFRRATEGFVERARRISEEQWSAPTPCAEWDVRALVNHVAGEYVWVPEMLAGKTVAEVGDRFDGDLLGEDPLARLAEARDAAITALVAPGASERTVHLSFGDLAAVEYAKQMAIDSTIHSWDLARASGGDEQLDPELVELSYAELQRSAEDWRSAGLFGAQTAAADDSAQGRLLAITGR
jgi:uncharacterized protein (TIGR03086 family)